MLCRSCAYPVQLPESNVQNTSIKVFPQWNVRLKQELKDRQFSSAEVYFLSLSQYFSVRNSLVGSLNNHLFQEFFNGRKGIQGLNH